MSELLAVEDRPPDRRLVWCRPVYTVAAMRRDVDEVGGLQCHHAILKLQSSGHCQDVIGSNRAFCFTRRRGQPDRPSTISTQDLPQLGFNMIRSYAVPLSLIVAVLWASLSSAADPDKDRTHHLRSLGARFLATGFHAGWSGEGKRLVYGNFPSESGLQILEVATRKGRELSDVGKDPRWSPTKGRPNCLCAGRW